MHEIATVIGLVMSVIALVSIGYTAVVRLAKLEERVSYNQAILDKVSDLEARVIDRIAGLETKVTVIWDFLIRRAMSEAVEKGIAKINSPIVVNEHAKKWMSSLAGKLRTFYQQLGRHLTEHELMFEIERNYGEEILREVCLPNGLTGGACLLIAAEVAREVINESTASQ